MTIRELYSDRQYSPVTSRCGPTLLPLFLLPTVRAPYSARAGRVQVLPTTGTRTSFYNVTCIVSTMTFTTVVCLS